MASKVTNQTLRSRDVYFVDAQICFQNTYRGQYNAGSLELSDVTSHDHHTSNGADKDASRCMMAARRLRKVAETSTFNQIAESALKSFYAGNFSEARFKYDVASDYGVSSSGTIQYGCMRKRSRSYTKKVRQTHSPIN